MRQRAVSSLALNSVSQSPECISVRDTGCLGLVHWDDPEGGYGEGAGRREEGSGWGARVYLWRIHFDVWQN